MRIAIFSDLHGNPIALDAVLVDLEARGGVDEYWVLGDFAAIGFDPLGVLERVKSLSNVRLVRGNTDRYISTGTFPYPSLEEVDEEPERLRLHHQVVRSFAWTQGAVTSAGWLPWLDALPLETRMTLPDGTRVLAVHASPGQDDGEGFHPGLNEIETQRLLAGCEEDLIFVGHNHCPMDKTVSGTRIVNVGSVSNPFPPDLRASYVLLEGDPSGYRVEFNPVEYDREECVRAIRAARHPAEPYLLKFITGQHLPKWVRTKPVSDT